MRPIETERGGSVSVERKRERERERERERRERTRTRRNLPQSRAYVGKLARQRSEVEAMAGESSKSPALCWVVQGERATGARSLNGRKRE